MSPLDLTLPSGLMLAFLPSLVLTAWSLVVLLVIGWRHRTEADSRLAGILSAIGIGFAGLATLWMWFGDVRAAGVPHMAYLDGYRYSAELLVLFIALTTCLLSLRFMGRQRLLAPEYYALVLFATIGMQLMVSSSDLVLIFLGLEVMSVSIYVLAGYDRFRRSSAEAALKYFLVGAFASGFLLYGIALTYGATGQTNLVLAGQTLAGMSASTLAQVGLGMLLIGFGFKVAAVPFHMWAPDVYDGAPTPVTGFMATGVKTAGFIALLRLLNDGFGSMDALWQPALAVLAILSIVVGNIVALAQTSMKRLLAYSSIAHAGYLLVAVWAASPAGHMAVLLYLWAYSLTSLAAFGVVAAVEHVGARTVRIEDLEGLFRTRPWGAMSMSVCLLSLLGFPGTFGFIGKWLIMSATLERGQVVLPVLVGLGSLVSLGYYLPVIMAMTMKPERSPEAHRQVLFSQAGKLIIAGAVAAIIFLGIWPRIPLDLGRRTVDSMTKPSVVAAEQP
ncbi:MAG TPA: NADH-quinone oxidoreductase subunit N [Gemmatimonadales bacterium]|nr:NADH-quinone oxidoreductase subunit N [Gemmatimonadales bacterium]